MVAGWRAQWGLGELPFYFVEIAPFGYGNGLSPYLREAQCRAQKLIPGSGMVSTNDLVLPCEEGNIHPRDKRSVGRRLAFWALNRTYGRKDVACENMQFRSMEIKDGKACLSFDNTFGGFGRAFDLRGFEICGADRVFRPAQVHFEGNERLIVFCPTFPNRWPCVMDSAIFSRAMSSTPANFPSYRSAPTIFNLKPSTRIL